MAHTGCPGGPFMMTQVVLGDHLCRETSELVTANRFVHLQFLYPYPGHGVRVNGTRLAAGVGLVLAFSG